VQTTEAVNVLKEIRVRIDEANREYDDMGATEQFRHGEEVWLNCVQDVRSMVGAHLNE
jgi:hypothetical protein